MRTYPNSPNHTAQQAEEERLGSAGGGALRAVFNAQSVLADAAAAMVDDSFLRCFQENHPDPWNWNPYLFPLWWA